MKNDYFSPLLAKESVEILMLLGKLGAEQAPNQLGQWCPSDVWVPHSAVLIRKSFKLGLSGLLLPGSFKVSGLISMLH